MDKEYKTKEWKKSRNKMEWIMESYRISKHMWMNTLMSCLEWRKKTTATWASIAREEEQRFFPLSWRRSGCFISFVLHYYGFLSFGKEFNIPSFQTLWSDSFPLEFIPPKFLWKSFDLNRPATVWNGGMKNRGKEENTGIENECR